MAALAQDLITRIVNIKWPSPGAVFIVTNGFDHYYIKIASKTADPVIHKLTLPDSPKGPVFRTLASSYKRINDTPTFLLCGFVDYQEGAHSTLASVILISNDGLSWRHVFMSETGIDGPWPWTSAPSAIVWSVDTFYYDQRVARPGLPQAGTPTGVSPWAHEQVYKSADGETWSGPIFDEQIWYGAETSGYRSPFPPAYCTHNDCKDTLEQNVPDGHMKHDADKNVLMRPKMPITINYGVPSYVYGTLDVVEIVKSGTNEVTVPGETAVHCVAGLNGIWMAGGRNGIAVSRNDGEAWSRIDGVDLAMVRSISVAPPEDFSADARL